MLKHITLLLLTAISFYAFSQEQTEFEKLVLGANAKFAEGDYEGAVADYTTATTMAPYEPVVWNNLARAQNELWYYLEALENFTKAIELDSLYVEAIMHRGYAYENYENYEQAISDYTKAIRIEPAIADVYFRRGYVYLIQENYSAAIEDITKYLNFPDANKDDAYFYLAVSKNRSELFKEAMEDLKKISDELRKDPSVVFEVGYYHKGLKEWDKAIEAFSKVIELDEYYIDAWHLRGLCKIELSDADGGCKDLTQADELGSAYAIDDIIEYCE